MRGVRTIMKKLLPFSIVLALCAIGCKGGGDSGDVDAAAKASAAAPKTVDQLPADMPPEAKRAAAGAMAQQQAMAQQADAQNRARIAAGE